MDFSILLIQECFTYDLLVVFLMSSLAFVLMVLYIYAYSIGCLLSPFSVIRAGVGDYILD